MYSIINEIIAETMALASITLLASMSPGPDMILVVKNSLLHGKKEGTLTSIGIGLGMLVHVSYCIAGVAILISQSILAFSLIKGLGALYLMYLGILLLREKNKNKEIKVEEGRSKESKPRYAYIKEGFICNALNPKATVFVLALYTQFIKIDASLQYKVAIGLMMALVTGLWFIILTQIIGHRVVRKKASNIQYYLGKLFGSLLLLLGVKIILDK